MCYLKNNQENLKTNQSGKCESEERKYTKESATNTLKSINQIIIVYNRLQVHTSYLGNNANEFLLYHNGTCILSRPP